MAAMTVDMYNRIDQHLESIYPDSICLASEIKKSGLDTKSQLRGFETLVNSTTRFSEIVNYIKNQAGKENKQAENWRKVAAGMLAQLERLEATATDFAGGDAGLLLEVKLRLARGWAKQVVCHYLYARSNGAS